MIDIVKPIECTGCYGCVNVCPMNCISMEKDVEGFEYPKIDYDECIECNICEHKCPSLHFKNPNKEGSMPEVHAAWSLDEDIRFNSTSVGIFSELAKEVLRNGGYVCGAKYNERHMVEHCIIRKEEDLPKIRQSKYVQSQVGTVYNDIKNLLLENKRVLFCGTPCECAALINVVGEKDDNLTVVDFVCRGANSPEVYKRYLAKLEEEFGSKVSKVWFKNKTKGWNRFSTKVEFEDGQYYLKDRYSDLYMRGYIEANLYMRLCCSDCKYKSFPRVSDITLADFWGIKLKDETKDTDKGTSLVMINSPKGLKLYNGIKSRIFDEEKSIEDTFRGNVCITTSAKPNEKKDDFIKHLDDMDIMENIERFCKKR